MFRGLYRNVPLVLAPVLWKYTLKNMHTHARTCTHTYFLYCNNLFQYRNEQNIKKTQGSPCILLVFAAKTLLNTQEDMSVNNSLTLNKRDHKEETKSKNAQNSALANSLSGREENINTTPPQST